LLNGKVRHVGWIGDLTCEAGGAIEKSLEVFDEFISIHLSIDPQTQEGGPWLQQWRERASPLT